jgi:hypothetical protein
MTTTPQITTPEGIEGMVAPGQEALLEEFVQEQQQQQEPELLLGKFKSQDDLAKAYQELEKKLGQASTTDPEAPSPAQGYSPEQAIELYGEGAANALADKGVDLADVMFKADQGEDISEHYDTLAEAFNVPRQVVENYVAKTQVQGSAPAEAPGLTEADAAQLKAMVGGDAAFTKLSQWAASNLEQGELAKYNAVVDSGNKDAIEWALKALQARVAAPDAVVEPKLYGGGEAPAVTQFQSQQQVLDAMNKRNSRGQRMYDVDEAYRDKVQRILAVSDVF